jgi:hypothetical protein
MKFLALFLVLSVGNIAYGQCAGGNCAAPQSAPMQSFPVDFSRMYQPPPMQWLPQQAPQYQSFTPGSFVAPEAKKERYADLRIDLEQPCIHVYDRSGEYLGTIWPRENAWQYPGVKTMHRLDSFVAKYHPAPIERDKYTLPIFTGKPRAGVCECVNCECGKR